VISPPVLLLAIAVYVLALFAVATWAERRSRRTGGTPAPGRRFAALPSALVMTVYCTSWTFYGSIGSAANSGILFLTIYFGPTLCAILWWFGLRRLIRIRDRRRITSISELVASRYGQSQGLGALVTVMAMVGIVPYIALQLQAVNGSFELLATPIEGAGAIDALLHEHFGLLIVVLVVLLTIGFGVRRLDVTERHPGMMSVVVAESAVKLVAFLAAGIFIVFGLFDGPGELVARATAADSEVQAAWTAPSFVTWTTFLILAGSAIVLLPRQFHVAVVECRDERTVHTAQWAIPLYLLAINLFVLPIAWAGLLMGYPASEADFFLLRLPVDAGRTGLSVLVFLGGLSAAFGMITVSAMAMATMISNTLLLPLADAVPRLAWIRRRLLLARWVVVAAFVAAGHAFHVKLGESYMLLSMGMMSFAAILQFAPAIVLGLFWRGGNRVGAAWGLGAGFAAWLYTLMLPAIARSGWIPDGWIEAGPFGLEMLRPYGLLGITGLDPLSHAVFVSMAINISGYVLGSLSVTTTANEARQAREHVDVLGGALLDTRIDTGPDEVGLAERRRRMLAAVIPFVGEAEGRRMIDEAVAAVGLAEAGTTSLAGTADIMQLVERRLSGTVGPAAAYRAIWNAGILDEAEQARLAGTLADAMERLDLSPQELWRRISEFEDREVVLERQAEALEREVDARTAELRAALDEIGAARDVAEAANRAKSNFLANMSHELRTPMTAIVGFTDLLASDPGGAIDPAERRAMLESLRRNGDHLLAVINDVLDLSRIDAGAMTVELRETDPAAILEDVERLLRPNAESKGIELVVDIDGSVRGDVWTDPVRFRQIVINLVGNAIKFTEVGRVTVRAVRSDDSDAIEVAVSDTGIGMTREQAEGVFQRFRQADESMSRRFGGTGLGLAISRELAELLGGDIEVTSEPGAGSTFTVRIEAPSARERARTGERGTGTGSGTGTDQAVAASRDGGADQPPLQGLRILLVEDGPDNRRLIGFHLQRAGAVVEMAEDGIEGVAAWERAAACGAVPDVVLMDMQMPRLDGYEATARLRELGCARPIIAVTAHAMDGDRERCMAAGCDDYLTKPIAPKTLVAACARYGRQTVRRQAS
jgi:signal transduction histidine kinase/ActR/RegA family two-component response regulator